jgi:hypothetical protein
MSPVLCEEINLKVGTIQLLAGFSEKKTGTKDSRRGEISRDKPPLVIGYDIGRMAGLHMSPGEMKECVWFKEQTVNDGKYYIGMEKKDGNKILIISVIPKEGWSVAHYVSSYPANFWATVRTEEDIADAILIATSYCPTP